MSARVKIEQTVGVGTNQASIAVELSDDFLNAKALCEIAGDMWHRVALEVPESGREYPAGPKVVP